jgi:hypothetical protein
MDESMVSVEDGESAIVVLSPIANPLATDKLSKKILKLVKAGNAINPNLFCVLCRS